MKGFALKILAGVFLIFGLVYMTMVLSSLVSFWLYAAWCIILGLLGIGLFIYADLVKDQQVKSGFIGIISGLLLWSFIGEFLAAINWITVADWRYSPMLVIGIIFFIFLLRRGYLPIYALFAFGHFLIIWLLHSIMVFEIHTLGKSEYPSVHPTTFITAVVFLIIIIFSAWKILIARSKTICMVWVLSILLLAGRSWNLSGPGGLFPGRIQ